MERPHSFLSNRWVASESLQRARKVTKYVRFFAPFQFFFEKIVFISKNQISWADRRKVLHICGMRGKVYTTLDSEEQRPNDPEAQTGKGRCEGHPGGQVLPEVIALVQDAVHRWQQLRGPIAVAVRWGPGLPGPTPPSQPTAHRGNKSRESCTTACSRTGEVESGNRFYPHYQL